MDTGKRVVVNTLAQHIRTILNTCMSLYSTRLVLSALGESDFGIFSLIGSMVAMLGFITNAMVVSTQRHLSFAFGKKTGNIRMTFSNSLFIHLFIGIVLSVAFLLVEPLLFDHVLQIDSDRIDIAKKVYYVVVLILFITFITAPYRALFIARENIVYISIIDFLDGALRLGMAIYLLYITYDKLIVYSFMVASISLFNYLAFVVYAKMHFEETILWPKKSALSRNELKRQMGFAGWTFYSTGCIVGRTQGISIVLNHFFGTILNTAYGIASQVSGAVQFVAQAIINAMSPQIIKAEGSGERKKMLALAELASKYSFLLLSMVVIPLVFEMPKILEAWLGTVPEHTATFCSFILASSLVDQITIGLGIANQAIGRIRNYSIIVNTTKFMTIPIAFACLWAGMPVVATMWVYIIVEAICALIRLPFLKVTAGLSITGYVSNVFLKVLPPVAITSVFCIVFISNIHIPFRFFLTGVLSVLIEIAVVWFASMTGEERKFFIKLIKSRK